MQNGIKIVAPQKINKNNLKILMKLEKNQALSEKKNNKQKI